MKEYMRLAIKLVSPGKQAICKYIAGQKYPHDFSLHCWSHKVFATMTRQLPILLCFIFSTKIFVFMFNIIWIIQKGENTDLSCLNIQHIHPSICFTHNYAGQWDIDHATAISFFCILEKCEFNGWRTSQEQWMQRQAEIHFQIMATVFKCSRLVQN